MSRHDTTTMDGTRNVSRRRKRVERSVLLLLVLSLPLSFGCWEQIDDGKWFPQMKRQIAVQAFEEVTANGKQVQAFVPPEGTVPIDWYSVADVASLKLPEQEALQNPVPATLSSLKNGEVLFQRYCSTCHGPQGHGDGPLAGPPFGKNGPLGMVLPIGGPTSLAKGLSDGHIFTTISLGRGRMPSYKRIRPMERWDLINYIRDLNGQGGR